MLDLAEVLLDRGASLDAPDNAGHTPLFHAALAGNQVGCLILLYLGADISRLVVTDDTGSCPFSRLLGMVDIFLDEAFSRCLNSQEPSGPVQEDTEQWCPSDKRIRPGQEHCRGSDILLFPRRLCEMAAYIDAGTFSSSLQLDAAAKSGFPDVVSALLRNTTGGRFTNADKSGALKAALEEQHWVLEHAEHQQKIEEDEQGLLNDVDVTRKRDQATRDLPPSLQELVKLKEHFEIGPVIKSHQEGITSVVQIFITKGDHIVDDEILLSSIRNGNIEIFRMILGADTGRLPCLRDGRALIQAVQADNADSLRTLLTLDIQLDTIEAATPTALLQCAVAHGCLRVIELLLRNGADPYAQGSAGSDALQLALTKPYAGNALLVLLDRGDGNVRWAPKPIDICRWVCMRDERRALLLLQKHQAAVSMEGAGGQQLLSIAMERGYSELRARLVELGVEPDEATYFDMLPGGSNPQNTIGSAALLHRSIISSPRYSLADAPLWAWRPATWPPDIMEAMRELRVKHRERTADR